MMRIAFIAVALAGCLHDPDVYCADGRVCPPDFVCDDAHATRSDGGCVKPDRVSACSGGSDNTPCTAQSIASGACQGGVCFAIACGNGFVEPGEACDDGNTISLDGCSADCTSNEQCGNGHVDLGKGEQCDDGNLRGQDGCSSTCQVETPAWRLLDDYLHATPPIRDSATMVYDARRGRTVMFGGPSLADTWEWDGLLWRQPNTIVAPFGRQRAAMVYDARRGRTVLFGGENEGPFDDTWEWNGVRWTATAPPTAPAARAGHAMAYDSARGKTVMYGGLNADQDTWEWDGTSWTLAATSGPPQSNPAVMAFDARRARVVFLGTSADSVTQTWEWDGVQWQNVISAISPPPCSHGCPMVFDARRGRIVLESAHDTWAYDGSTWQVVTPVSGAPDGDGGAMSYDLRRDRIVLFNATFVGSTLVDSKTYEYDGSAWVVPVTSAPIAPLAPTAYDALRGVAVVIDGSGPAWEWDTVGWTAVTSANAPTGYGDVMLSYAGERGVVMGYSGDPNAFPAPQTWTWNGADWTQTGPFDPYIFDGAMVYDASRDRVVLFGGSADPGWEWDGTSWTNALVMPSMLFLERTNPAAAYDSTRAHIVGFGGHETPPGIDLAETWDLDGATWTLMSPNVSPPKRTSPALAFDPGRNRTVLFGGVVSATTNFDDTWEWDGTTWRQLAVAAAAAPPAGLGQQPYLVYDAVDESLLLDSNWVLRWESDSPHEVCRSGFDVDGDGLVGCADPDCWGYCTPVCPPGATCDPAAPHCGDGVCGAVEDCRLCPQDCGACTPICGDYLCDPGETPANCPGDCS